MKSIKVKVLSVCLALIIAFSGVSCVGASAADAASFFTKAGVSALEVIIRGVIGGLCAIVPDSKSFKKLSDHVSEYFYTGTDELLSVPAADAKWQLGYAKASLVPDDVLDKDKEYYLGGFMTFDNGMNNKIEEIIDDMQIRAIAVSDNSGRGVSVFANVDCIGFCNGDIKTVRKYFEEIYDTSDINSLNITSTHCHSCIDTQGLWTNQFKKIFGNLAKSYFPFLEKDRGVNTEWLDWACHIMAETMKDAVESMTDGTLTYAVKSLNEEYFSNRNRKSSTSLCRDMSRFVFTPSDSSKTPTMIVNIAAHPDVTGLATSDKEDNGRQLSGDYVYYLGEQIEKGGYNFMFVNGAIAGIYYGRGLSGDGVDLERRYMQAERYGREMGNIALNLTKTYDEIDADYRDIINREIADEKAKNPDFDESNYTVWYENCEYNPETKAYDLNWEPVTEVELEPIFNLTIREVKIPVRNPLMKLVGKLELVNYNVYKEGLTYYMFSEIGYAQFGKVKVAMMPGEIVQDLVYGGGSLTAEGSFKGKDFGLPYIRQIFGEDTICFGLCNDAIGYVVPDNDYSLGIVDDHYQELISLGDRTASSIMSGFVDLAEELNINNN
ncbi:MAG: hypothetical protein K6F64_09880 [Clostridia bacterium]|nr:hypothetical protein [Clostridia bacterium]